jgi:hypothetical protein
MTPCEFPLIRLFQICEPNALARILHTPIVDKFDGDGNVSGVCFLGFGVVFVVAGAEGPLTPRRSIRFVASFFGGDGGG